MTPEEEQKIRDYAWSVGTLGTERAYLRYVLRELDLLRIVVKELGGDKPHREWPRYDE